VTEVETSFKKASTITRRGLLSFAAPAFACAFAMPRAFAEVWPNRFVRLVVPYAAGGPTDAVARILADPLARIWRQQMVIENKGGGGTNIGAEAVARSDADGYTVLLGSSALSMNRSLYHSLNYDAIADFAPVTLIVRFAFFMCVPNSSPARTVEQFIAYAKEKGGKLSYATPGVGTPPHMAGELLKRTTGIEMIHVPYRGGGPAWNDLIPGRVDLQFASGIALELIKSGQVRALAVSSAERNAATPELPTVAEAGVPGFEVSSWYGFLVPARTPPDIISKMNADTVAGLAQPAVRARLEQLGYTVIGSTAQELAAYLRSDIEKWGPVIKAAGIRIDG
jgi:tripartite-type tricarboxylate transporter receptor subunit TctC